MSNWWYVAIAYTIVWGALAAYAVVLARRVAQAREVAKGLQDALDTDATIQQDSVSCDAPPAS